MVPVHPVRKSAAIAASVTGAVAVDLDAGVSTATTVAAVRPMFILPRVNLKTSSTTADDVHQYASQHHQHNHHNNSSNSCISGHHQQHYKPRSAQAAESQSSYEHAANGGGSRMISGMHHVNDNKRATTAAATTTTGRGPPSLLHYSTEKSGSSGYYSSHVYSTSSFDEHIYSEPVSGAGSVGAASRSGGGGGIVVVLDSASAGAAKAAVGVSVTGVSAAAGKANALSAQICRDNSATMMHIVDRLQPPVAMQPALVAADQQRHRLRNHQQQTHHQSAGLVNLESSIKNLELHLKAFSRPVAHADVDVDADNVFDEDESSCSIDLRYDKRKSVRLPTIMEGIDGQPSSSQTLQPKQQLQQPSQATNGSSPRVAWQDPDLDDSLMDLDLDSFMMANELPLKASQTAKTLQHPQSTGNASATALRPPTDGPDDDDDNLPYDNKSIENNYKCRKYINSCPDDPYNIDDPHTGVTVAGSTAATPQLHQPPPPPSFDKSTLATYLHQCNDRVHYQNTRQILEEIRLKLTALLSSDSKTTNAVASRESATASSSSGPNVDSSSVGDATRTINADDSASLQHSIRSLKGDLDNYLGIMNASNEQEIRQLCNGLSKDHKLVTIQNALGNRSRRIRCPDRSCSNYAPSAAAATSAAASATAAVDPPSGAASMSMSPAGAANSTATTATAGTASVSSYTEREETQFDTVYVRDGFSFGYKSKIPFRLDFTKTQTPSQPTQIEDGHHYRAQQMPNERQRRAAPSFDGQHHIKFKCSPCSSCEEMMMTTTATSSGDDDDDDDDDDDEVNMVSGEEYTASTSDDVVRHSARYASPKGGPAALMQHYPHVFDGRIIVADELKVPAAFYHQQQQQQHHLHQQQQHQQHQHQQERQHNRINADYHQDKPSIWEQYYGTNRLNHTFFKIIKGHQNFMTYPSERPESDFTLDLPQAEQLRLKMKREKQFRHRCRIVTSFLSLVFFLLTVVVVSLLLTRGKHPFGSMI